MRITDIQFDNFIDSIFYENFGVMFPCEHIFSEHYNVDDEYLKSRAKKAMFL